MKRRAASARRSLAMQHPLVLPKAGSQVSGESSGKGLALEVCRPSKAVLQSWDEKVFPGEGIGFESARDKTFTGRRFTSQDLQLLLSVVPQLPVDNQRNMYLSTQLCCRQPKKDISGCSTCVTKLWCLVTCIAELF